MNYQLGIDLGTTYTAAAVCRSDDRHAADPEVVTLGTRAAAVPSVLYLGADGSLLVGEAAERRAVTEPDRVVRQFKRRIGDETPVVVGGVPHQAHDLAARMIAWVVDRVTEREGGRPGRIAVTHPASWGTHKTTLLTQALAGVGLRVALLAEPQAAAVSYAGTGRLESGSTIAVYDLGGGTFDAAVVRKGPDGFELLGRPEGLAHLGGVDFDEAVFDHVRSGLGAALDALDPGDEAVLAAVARLRRECTEAKEALSADTEVSIPVLLPALRTSVRLVRGEFEAMIHPAVQDTVEALRRAVASAALRPADLTAVLLVGGSSRIPLVAQLVSAELDRPIAVDADPKNAIALGAALAVSPRPAASRHAVAVPLVPPDTGGTPGGAPSAPRPPATVPVDGPLRPVARQSTTPGGAPRRVPAPDRVPAGVRSAGPAPTRSTPTAGRRASRRSMGPLVAVGGLVATAAIVAALLLWGLEPRASTPTVDSTPTSEAPAPAGRVPDTGRNSSPGGAVPAGPDATPAPFGSPTDSPTPTTLPAPSTEDPPPTDPPTTEDPPPTETPTTEEAPPTEPETPPDDTLLGPG